MSGIPPRSLNDLRNTQSRDRLRAQAQQLQAMQADQAAWDQWEALVDEAFAAEGEIQPREGGSRLGNFALGVASRPAQALVGLGQAATGVADALVPGEGMASRANDFLDNYSDQIEAGVGNSVAANVGRVGGDIGMALLSGAATPAALGRLGAAMPRAQRTLQAIQDFGAGGTSRLARAGRQALVGEVGMLPFDVSQAVNPNLSLGAAFDPEMGFGGRLATEIAAGVGGSAALGAVFPGLLRRAPQVMRGPTQAAAQAAQAPAAPALSEADQLAGPAADRLLQPPVRGPRALNVDAAGVRSQRPAMGAPFAEELVQSMRQTAEEAAPQAPLGTNPAFLAELTGSFQEGAAKEGLEDPTALIRPWEPVRRAEAFAERTPAAMRLQGAIERYEQARLALHRAQQRPRRGGKFAASELPAAMQTLRDAEVTLDAIRQELGQASGSRPLASEAAGQPTAATRQSPLPNSTEFPPQQLEAVERSVTESLSSEELDAAMREGRAIQAAREGPDVQSFDNLPDIERVERERERARLLEAAKLWEQNTERTLPQERSDYRGPSKQWAWKPENKEKRVRGHRIPALPTLTPPPPRELTEATRVLDRELASGIDVSDGVRWDPVWNGRPIPTVARPANAKGAKVVFVSEAELIARNGGETGSMAFHDPVTDTVVVPRPPETPALANPHISPQERYAATVMHSAKMHRWMTTLAHELEHVSHGKMLGSRTIDYGFDPEGRKLINPEVQQLMSEWVQAAVRGTEQEAVASGLHPETVRYIRYFFDDMLLAKSISVRPTYEYQDLLREVWAEEFAHRTVDKIRKTGLDPMLDKERFLEELGKAYQAEGISWGRAKFNARLLWPVLLTAGVGVTEASAMATEAVAQEPEAEGDEPPPRRRYDRRQWQRPSEPSIPGESHPLRTLGLVAAGLVGGAAGVRVLRSMLAPATRAAAPEAMRGAEALIERGAPTATPTGRQTLQRVAKFTLPLEREEAALGRAGVALGPTERPSLMAEQALFGPARRFHEAAYGTGNTRFVDGSYEPVGRPSLGMLVRSLSDTDQAALEPYLLASRLTELRRVRPDLPMGLNEAQYAELARTVASAPESVKKAAPLIHQWLDDAFQYWIDAGGFAPEVAQTLRRLYDNYIPLYRLLDETNTIRERGPGALSIAQQVLRLEGGKGKFAPPLESILDYGRRLYRSADQLRIGRSIADMVDTAKAAGIDLSHFATRVHGAPRVAGVERDAFVRMLDEIGAALPEKEADALLSALRSEGPTVEGSTMALFRNGKREYWKVNAEVAESLQSLAPPQISFIWRFLGLPTAALRFGVTANPVFTAFNAIRDQFIGFAQSQFGMNPLRGDTARALRDIVKARTARRWSSYLKDPELAPHPAPDYEEWLRAGGGFGLTAEAGSRLSSTMQSLPGQLGANAKRSARMHEVNLLSGKATLFDTGIIRGWQELLTPFEEATRFAEYRRARAAGKTPLEAAKAAQDVSVNFAMHGSDTQTMAVLSHIIPFFNPAIQSLYRTGELAVKNPKNLALKLTAGITVPTTALYLLNRDDEQIQELRRTPSGTQYWFARVPGSDIIMRFPKPFLYGQLFGTGMEQALDHAFADLPPQRASELGQALWQQVAPNILPTAVSLTQGLATGVDPHFGNPIEPTAASDLQPAYRARSDTSPLLEQLAQRFNLSTSPAKMEWALRQLTGRLGTDFLRALDLTTSEGRERPLSAQPFVGGFFQANPTANTFSQRRFYQDYHLTHEAQRQFYQLQRYRAQDLPQWLASGKNRQLLEAAPIYEAGHSMLSAIRQQMQLIEAQVPPAERTARLRPLYASLQRIAKSYVGILDSLTSEPQ